MSYAQKLLSLIERANMTRKDFAIAIGLAGLSSLQRYYSSEFDEKPLPFDFVFSSLKVLCGKGNPPITKADIIELSGDKANLFVAYEEPRTESAFGKVEKIKEIDAYCGAGCAAEGKVVVTTDGNGETHLADAVKGTWDFPSEYIRELRVTPETARIVEVIGDSMEPTLRSGDKVMVDTSISGRCPSPPGIFVLWDGFGVCVKRLEIIPNSDPAALRIISDNPNNGTYERLLSDCNIIGRVMWFSRRS